ncbi:hypothetical protein FVE85_1266 [Porphyridium purpureum]|uniref:Myb-like domain-containing protein n=1 Tax=Porphyridium purpureum TaxID=35688 RepID=A0A5J4YHD1_PORPP|nr:hypothetical protein FVE85_1266 [Porphyridium purpureum]|eukprot:POR8657..scf251_18
MRDRPALQLTDWTVRPCLREACGSHAHAQGARGKPSRFCTVWELRGYCAHANEPFCAPLHAIERVHEHRTLLMAGSRQIRLLGAPAYGARHGERNRELTKRMASVFQDGFPCAYRTITTYLGRLLASFKEHEVLDMDFRQDTVDTGEHVATRAEPEFAVKEPLAGEEHVQEDTSGASLTKASESVAQAAVGPHKQDESTVAIHHERLDSTPNEGLVSLSPKEQDVPPALPADQIPVAASQCEHKLQETQTVSPPKPQRKGARAADQTCQQELTTRVTRSQTIAPASRGAPACSKPSDSGGIKRGRSGSRKEQASQEQANKDNSDVTDSHAGKTNALKEWSKSDIKRYNDACARIPMQSGQYWTLVAYAVGTKTAEQCIAKWQSQVAGSPNSLHREGGRSTGVPDSAKVVQWLNNGKKKNAGTAKYRKFMRSVAASVNELHHEKSRRDDVYESTPFRKSRELEGQAQVMLSQMLGDEEGEASPEYGNTRYKSQEDKETKKERKRTRCSPRLTILEPSTAVKRQRRELGLSRGIFKTPEVISRAKAIRPDAADAYIVAFRKRLKGNSSQNALPKGPKSTLAATGSDSHALEASTFITPSAKLRFSARKARQPLVKMDASEAVSPGDGDFFEQLAGGGEALLSEDEAVADEYYFSD